MDLQFVFGNPRSKKKAKAKSNPKKQKNVASGKGSDTIIGRKEKFMSYKKHRRGKRHNPYMVRKAAGLADKLPRYISIKPTPETHAQAKKALEDVRAAMTALAVGGGQQAGEDLNQWNKRAEEGRKQAAAYAKTRDKIEAQIKKLEAQDKISDAEAEKLLAMGYKIETQGRLLSDKEAEYVHKAQAAKAKAKKSGASKPKPKTKPKAKPKANKPKAKPKAKPKKKKKLVGFAAMSKKQLAKVLAKAKRTRAANAKKKANKKVAKKKVAKKKVAKKKVAKKKVAKKVVKKTGTRRKKRYTEFKRKGQSINFKVGKSRFTLKKQNPSRIGGAMGSVVTNLVSKITKNAGLAGGVAVGLIAGGFFYRQANQLIVQYAPFNFGNWWNLKLSTGNKFYKTVLPILPAASLGILAYLGAQLIEKKVSAKTAWVPKLGEGIATGLFSAAIVGLGVTMDRVLRGGASAPVAGVSYVPRGATADFGGVDFTRSPMSGVQFSKQGQTSDFGGVKYLPSGNSDFGVIPQGMRGIPAGMGSAADFGSVPEGMGEGQCG